MRLFALALAFLALGGCVEYRESIVLERDQSGTVVMAIGVKGALLRAAEVAESGVYDPASALDALRALPGLQVIESRAEAHDGTRWLHLVLTFDSLPALNGINRIEQYRTVFGTVTLTENGAGQQALTRTVQARLPEALGKFFLPSLLAPVIDGYPWSYEVRLPARVVESNGDAATGPEGDARVVRWTFNLADLVSEPRVMHATFARTGVGPAGIAVGAALMVFGIAIAWMLQRHRNRAGAS
ncbi:MAG: hypothetical protein OXI15_12295 [Chromatiales bacterium]|nr:hypothetical protein [Chromatiales bacterium]